MRCPVGCRTRHEARASSERSADYYKSGPGRKKKKALNRKRSQQSGQPGNADHENKEEERLPAHLRYYRWLLLLLDGIRTSVAELKQFYKLIRVKVRQRGQDIFGELRHIPDD